jgi:iron complex outermembrane receptor protein
MSIIVRTSISMIYRRTMSTLRLAPIAFLLFCMLGGSDPAVAQIADRPLQINLPASDLADALDKLGDQSGVQIMYEPALAQGIKVQAVSGTLTVDDALKQLLAKTGLRADRVNDKTVVLTRAEAKKDLPKKEAPFGPVTKEQNETPPDTLEQVVVTGTHIARPEVESAMPISVINANDAKDYGYNTVYDALRLDPAIGPGIGEMNSAGQEYDQGVANINLRNMGANRSLVLVDGERWVSSGARTSAVDLNTIPTALIDHYEVVTGGAAAIYGADAVTGAVNIIMKKQMSGLDISATSGISGQGDANQSNVSVATGSEFGDGRGHFVIGGDYTYTAPLDDSARYPDRVSYYPNPAYTGPSSGVPANLLNTNTRQLNRSSVPSFCLPSGTKCQQWYQLTNGVVTPVPQSSYTVISSGETGAQMGGPSTAGDAYEELLMRSKSQKGSLYMHTSYELTPTITWNGTLSYAHSFNVANPEWPQVRDDQRPTNWWGGTTGEIATLTNPYLPASLSQFMIANNLTAIPLDRTYLNLPQAFERDQRDNITLGSDIGGEFTGALKWQAFVRYGRVTDHITTTNMVGKNEWLNARNTITDPVTGQIECADPTARANGCQPLNFFSTAPYSQALLNYIENNRYEYNENSLLNTGGNINGNVFSLPAGDVSIAAGFAWRRETLETRDDPDTAKLYDVVFSPGEDYALHPALNASRETTELYGETVIPVLKDLPLAKRLDVEAAYRFSHYSDEPNTNTWKGGGSWEPVSGFTLRGNYSHSVRVPNFGELYSPGTTTTLGQIADPCQASYINQNPNYKANCAAILNGISVPLPSPNLNAPVVAGGGNSNLTPETSNSYTVGAVIQPTFLGNLDLTIDYWNIEISNAITSLPYLTILNDCFNSAGGPNQTYCGLVTRDSQGNVVNVQAEYANLAAQQARGIDFGANYRTSIGEGQFRAKFVGTYVLQQEIIAAKGQAGTDYAGEWDYPTFKATMLTEYSIGMVTFGANTRFISRSRYNAAVPTYIYQDPYIPAYVDSDLTVTVRPTDSYSVTFGVNDVSNAAVPLQLQANAITPHSAGGTFAPGGNNSDAAADYGAIGRYFFLTFRAHF